MKAAVVNRTNEVYNDDLAIKLVLVNNNNLLAFNTAAQFTGANGPCGVAACFTPTASDDLSGCTAEKIEQTGRAITAVIGRDSYDVGHILDNGTKGGIATLAGVGKDAIKGEGCSGVDSGRGDNLAVAFLADEIGHQLGATHTFSSASCGGFENMSALEPGSGATIMGYAGVCDARDNIQRPSDPYFSHFSIRQIQTYVNSTVDVNENGGLPVENGGMVVATTNRSPIVTVPVASAIPVRTPFTLSGTVTDADGQTPVNVWEQNDTGTIRPFMDNNKVDGPLFRIFSKATVSPDYDTAYNVSGLGEATAAGSTRTFPDAAQIAAGNTNAAGGTCPVPAVGATPTQDEIECFAEYLPTTARTMKFVLTARDRNVGGGGVTSAETVVTVAGTTPFTVTNPAGSVAGNSAYTVTWNVANTTAAPFNVANVKISYSTDGGLTFPTVLAASVANDGSEAVVIPAGLTSTARVKVEAIGQPFFDISHADLAVTAAVDSAPVFTAATPPATGTIGTAYSYTFAAAGSPVPTFAVASGALPAGLSLGATTGVLSGTPTTAGAATFTIRASNGIGTPAVTGPITVTINGSVGSAPVLTAASPPATGTIGTAYSYTFAAAGSPVPTFAVASGALPAGLSLGATTGVLSGTPTTAGAATFTIRASNGIGTPAVTGPITVTITIGAVPVVPAVSSFVGLVPARVLESRYWCWVVDGRWCVERDRCSWCWFGDGVGGRWSGGGSW